MDLDYISGWRGEKSEDNLVSNYSEYLEKVLVPKLIMSERNYEKDILKSIQDLPIIEYSKEKYFLCCGFKSSKEALQQLYELAHRLRENLISIPKSTLRLDEIDTGYRDRCLQSYCYDTLYLNKSW